MSAYRNFKLFRTSQRNVICILQNIVLLEIRESELKLQELYARIIILTLATKLKSSLYCALLTPIQSVVFSNC